MAIKLSEEQKMSILLSALDERYRSLHVIRERIQNVSFWTMGILFGVSGWLIQSGRHLNLEEKFLSLIGLVVLFVVLKLGYLSDLERGFKGQQRIAVRLEKSLGFFEAGVFGGDTEPMYPKSWEKAGMNEGEGGFLNNTYHLLYVGFGFLFLVIISSGCFF